MLSWKASHGGLIGVVNGANARAGRAGEYLFSATPGGSGAACTISNGSPAVVTQANHGLTVGSVGNFTTTGGLPTGLNTGENYFAQEIVSSSQFKVAAAPGGAAINTSSAGSGTHTFVPRAILTTAEQENAGGLLLPAGDWDVGGLLGLLPSGGAALTRIVGSISETSETLGADPGSYLQLRASFTANLSQVIPIPVQRFNRSTPTQLYLVSLTAFSSGAVQAYGRMWARRAATTG